MDRTRTLGLFAGIAAASAAFSQGLVYSNNDNFIDFFPILRIDPPTPPADFELVRGAEIGNQLVFSSGPFNITEFSFITFGFDFGRVEANVRFYRNDGPLLGGEATPGTLLWESGNFELQATGLVNPAEAPNFRYSITQFDVSDFGSQIPMLDTSMTWTVEFSKFDEPMLSGPYPTAGTFLGLYSPPTVGAVYPDMWYQENHPGPSSGWQLLFDPNIPLTFGAQLIPEPSTHVAMGIVTLGGLALWRRRRQN
jgi:hypothetical protein